MAVVCVTVVRCYVDDDNDGGGGAVACGGNEFVSSCFVAKTSECNATRHMFLISVFQTVVGILIGIRVFGRGVTACVFALTKIMDHHEICCSNATRYVL